MCVGDQASCIPDKPEKWALLEIATLWDTVSSGCIPQCETPSIWLLSFSSRSNRLLAERLRHDGAALARFQILLLIQTAEELDQLSHQSGPARLVARPQARAVVAMEIFVEQDVVLPVWIGLKFLRAAVNRPPPGLVPQEDPRQPVGDLVATSNRFIRLPEPVGHSILKLSP